ncbi:MAG: endonuclease/exonuclease/phosphatase family protein [Muribaculaceae bacterium]|nr:endonuclease/exonuclease/phosphatase family protein [Muribaculaceae bacterium]
MTGHATYAHRILRTLRISAATAACGLFIITIAGAYGGLIDPRTCIIPSLLCMAFPWLMLLSAAVTLLSLMWSRTTAIAGAVSLAICVPSAMSIVPLHTEKNASPHAKTLSVMTYNTYYFHDYATESIDTTAVNLTLRTILDADPDIVMMQESIYGAAFEYGEKLFPHTQSVEFVSRYPYHLLDNDYNNIFSKYPLTPHDIAFDNLGESSFIVGCYDADVDGCKVTLFNVHLQSLMLSEQTTKSVADASRLKPHRSDLSNIRHNLLPKLMAALRRRAAQAHELRTLIDSISGPIIVAGDFNDVPLCYASRIIAGHDLTDVYAASAFGPAATYRKRGMYFRIDQMFCGGGLVPLSCRRLTSGRSDHYPLLATFELPKNNNISQQ